MVSLNNPKDMQRFTFCGNEIEKVSNLSGSSSLIVIPMQNGKASKFIGDIRLFDEHSTVQLPQDMPADVLAHFQNVIVCQRPMRMTKSTPPADSGDGRL